MSVEFTQYLMPDGRKKQVFIDLDTPTEAKAQAIIATGYRFEIEMLSTLAISATIHNPLTEEDEDCELMNNGPEVPVRITAMINRFYEGTVKND